MSEEMPPPCNHEEQKAILAMTFSVCTDHGASKPTGGTFEIPPGVGPTEAINTAMGVIEQVISGLIAQHPQVRDYIQSHDLTKRGEHKVLTLFAHAHLQQMVAAANWARPEGVDFLLMPSGD